MQFSVAIKEAFAAEILNTGFTLTADESEASLTQAFSQFSSTQKTGPAEETSLPPLIWVAVKVIKPYMTALFAPDSPPPPQ